MGVLLDALKKLSKDREGLQQQLDAIDSELAVVCAEIGSNLDQPQRGSQKKASRAASPRHKTVRKPDLAQVRDDVLLALQDGPLGRLELIHKFSWSPWSVKQALLQLAHAKQIKRVGTNRWQQWALAMSSGSNGRPSVQGRSTGPSTALTTDALAVLTALRAKSPQSPSELANRSKITRPALTSRIKPLLKSGAVRASGATQNRQFSLPPAPAKEGP